MLLAFALAACTSDAPDSAGEGPDAGPDPWDDLDTPLDPLRELLVVDAGTGADGRLAPVSGVPALAAWPRTAGGLALLDARYRLASSYSCLDITAFPDFQDSVDRHGRCGAGLVELDRTHLGLTEAVVDVAEDPDAPAVSVLLGGGRVRVANTDLLVGSPWDWLRLGPTVVLATSAGAAPTQIVPAAGGGWWGTAGSTLARWSAAGALVDEVALPAAARDLVRSGESAWVSTAEGVVREDGASAAVGEAAGLAADGAGGVWAEAGGAGVVHVSAAAEAGDAVAVAGAAGPIAADARTGKVYVLTADAVVVLQGGAEVLRAAVAAPVAVAVNGSSEVSVLGADGQVHVYVDETALGSAPPLSAWIATFFENPRQVASKVDCSGDDEGMEERVARALANRDFFHDIPATVALGVSPAAAAHAKRCKVPDDLVALFDSDRLEPGVLFHDPPDCTDQGCVDAAVADDLAELTALDLHPEWISGAAGWETGAGDWVRALASLDMPARHAFVGLSALPDVSMDDPRAKDALPWAGEAEASPWHAASAADAGTDTPGGGLLLVPGNTQAAFNLGACPGALQVECRLLDLGGGDTLDADDLAVADLLLHRAAVHRSDSGGDTWYMHLPAIETYAYTDGCSTADRAWSGEGCQAALLQAWTFDVQARLVRAGAVRWGLPSDLPAP